MSRDFENSFPKFVDEEFKRKFFGALSTGCTYSLACDYVGIHYETFRAWRQRAKKKIEEGVSRTDDIYVNFYLDVKEVLSQRAYRLLDKIEEATNSDWKAAAWKLGKCYPNEYGDKRDKHPPSQVQNQESEQLKELKEMVLKCMKPVP